MINRSVGWYDETTYKILGLCALGFLIIIVIYLQSESKEYPFLSNEDSVNDQIINVRISRNSAYIILESNMKFHIHRSLNLKYKDHSSLAELISIGDRIKKNRFSDTLIIEHSGKKYLFLNNKTLGINENN
jgi:hypothetical protein